LTIINGIYFTDESYTLEEVIKALEERGAKHKSK